MTSSVSPPTQYGFSVNDEHCFASPSLFTIDFEDPTFDTLSLNMESNRVDELFQTCIRLTAPFDAAQNELAFHFEETLYNRCRDFRAIPFAPDSYQDDGSFAPFHKRMVSVPTMFHSGPHRPDLTQ